MRCEGGGVGLEGTLEFVEVVGVVADAPVVVAGAGAGAAAVAAVAGHLGGRRRTVLRSDQMGKRAMWVVAGIVVALKIIQQLFSRQRCRINEIESIYLAD